MNLLTSIVTPDNVASRWEDILQLFCENETLRNNQRSKGFCCRTKTGYSPMRSAEPRVAMKQCRSNLEAAFSTARELYKNAKVFCTVNGQERHLDYLCYRVQIALWVASAAKGTCEEIVAALLLPLHQKIMLHERTFFKKLSEQEQAVKAVYPDFDPEKAADNRVFKTLVDSGVPMLDAYRAAYSADLTAKAVEAAKADARNEAMEEYKRNGGRPREGASAGGGTNVARVGKPMTKEEAQNIIKRYTS